MEITFFHYSNDIKLNGVICKVENKNNFLLFTLIYLLNPIECFVSFCNTLHYALREITLP